MARTLTRAAFALALLSSAAFGQDTSLQGASAAILNIPHGLHIYEVSVYSGYMTTAYPTTGFALNTSSPLTGIGPDEVYGGKIGLGWQHHEGRTNVSLAYSAGYDGMVRYSAVNGFTQNLSLNLSRNLSSKWTVVLAGAGSDQTMAQFLFEPAQSSSATAAPLSFQDFAASLSAGQYSNSQIASILTGAPVLDSPAQSLMLGQRILSYSVQGGLTYAYSSRLQFHLTSFSAGGQSRMGDQTGAPSTEPGALSNYVMPRTVGGDGGGGFSYMLTPRTTVSFSADEYMNWNRYQRSRGTTGTASLGRKMSERWVLHVYGGGTVMKVRGDETQSLHQLVGGGSLGFKTYSQSFAASYDRSSYDSFGFAAGLVTTETGSWRWQRPGSAWWLSASFGEESMRNTGFASISGWRATGEIGWRVQNRAVLRFQYAHMQSSGVYTGMSNNLEVDSIRLSVGWVPVQFLR